MENETNISKKKQALYVVVASALLLSSMLFCAFLGYQLTKSTKKEPEQPIVIRQPVATPTPGFSTVSAEPELSPAATKKEDVLVPYEENDYLVIAEENAVNLYLLTATGEQHYQRTLEILPNTLPEEDVNRLTEGIILDTQEDLAGLLEDYTS